MYPELRKTMKSKDTLSMAQTVCQKIKTMMPYFTANMGTGGHNVPLVLTDEGYRKLTPENVLIFKVPKKF